MTGRKKLTDEKVAMIRRQAETEAYADIAREYGISVSYISLIRNGKRRKPRDSKE